MYVDFTTNNECTYHYNTASIPFLPPKLQTARVEDKCHSSSINCSHKPPMESFIPLKKPLDNLKFQVCGSNRDCTITSLLFQAVGAHMIDSLHPNFKAPFGCYVETGKNNDKLYYSIFLLANGLYCLT